MLQRGATLWCPCLGGLLPPCRFLAGTPGLGARCEVASCPVRDPPGLGSWWGMPRGVGHPPSPRGPQLQAVADGCLGTLCPSRQQASFSQVSQLPGPGNQPSRPRNQDAHFHDPRTRHPAPVDPNHVSNPCLAAESGVPSSWAAARQAGHAISLLPSPVTWPSGVLLHQQFRPGCSTLRDLSNAPNHV